MRREEGGERRKREEEEKKCSKFFHWSPFGSPIMPPCAESIWGNG